MPKKIILFVCSFFVLFFVNVHAAKDFGVVCWRKLKNPDPSNIVCVFLFQNGKILLSGPEPWCNKTQTHCNMVVWDVEAEKILRDRGDHKFFECDEDYYFVFLKDGESQDDYVNSLNSNIGPYEGLCKWDAKACECLDVFMNNGKMAYCCYFVTTQVPFQYI